MSDWYVNLGHKLPLSMLYFKIVQNTSRAVRDTLKVLGSRLGPAIASHKVPEPSAGGDSGPPKS